MFISNAKKKKNLIYTRANAELEPLISKLVKTGTLSMNLLPLYTSKIMKNAKDLVKSSKFSKLRSTVMAVVTRKNINYYNLFKNFLC